MDDKVLRRLPRFVKDINLIQPEYDLSNQVWRFPMRYGAGPNDWTMLHAYRANLQQYKRAINKNMSGLEMYQE